MLTIPEEVPHEAAAGGEQLDSVFANERFAPLASELAFLRQRICPLGRPLPHVRGEVDHEVLDHVQ